MVVFAFLTRRTLGRDAPNTNTALQSSFQDLLPMLSGKFLF